ncbi:SGNH/GDSL hydrolase family protein [Frondihabitans sp. VKM Ac-2883]|uniref:SGNH/GDSL hydrolase family protein n=1 Tax=Frondihabitans sp. VKM Ac-2883 TaxID=2783823 RepID=UPI00188B53FA|nr:SGNH/GDSL hydrolase family protein [Frondihabitans sp. VKM Ac-2883]
MPPTICGEKMTRRHPNRWIGAIAAVSVGLSVLMGTSAAQAAAPKPQDPNASLPPAASTPADSSNAIPAKKRDATLGSGWKATGDASFTSSGDADGFSILKATASGGYSWKVLATLSVAGVQTDRWVGNTCVTGDGSKVVAVYAPRSFTNDETQFGQGAWGAVVDTSTGAVKNLGRGFTLSYSNPGCGIDSKVALARFFGGRTFVGSLDAATGKALWHRSLPGQLTSLVANGDGTVFGAGPKGIVKVGSSGATPVVAATTGTAFDLTLVRGRLGFAERSGSTVTVSTASLTASNRVGSVTRMASGKLGGLGVQRDASNHLFVAGTVTKPGTVPTGVRLIAAGPGTQVSTKGRVAVESVTPSAGAAGDPGLLPASKVAIKTRSLITGKTFGLSSVLQGPTTNAPAAGSRTSGIAPRAKVLAQSSPSNPSEAERFCAVPRNDPRKQALQPKPRQVEWAVNRIVAGQLTIARPANWNSTGMAAYKPGTMFPTKALSGGGRIPSQVLLGVVSQESNLWQASRYTSPGETGNPLIGNFYGNDVAAAVGSTPFWQVSFSNADCGYGVAQVTDGMRLAGHEKAGETSLPVAQQEAVALDYTANLARAAQILTDKWNETRAAGVTINDGDPSKLENWFAALWAYNTGYHQPDGSGQYGLGWANNPANPLYPPDRTPFLDGHPADAAKPQNWPYPEKVLGFAASPPDLVEQQTVDTYTTVSAFRAAWWSGDYTTGPLNRSNVKPPIDLFCNTTNECNLKTASVCARTDLKCWFHQSATWKKDCASTCGNELWRFTPAADYMTEQPNGASFPPNCTRNGLPSNALIVDDVPIVTDAGTISANPANSTCSKVATTGSFSFDFGRRSDSGSYPSKIDTHQLGGGFNGHFFFTHTWQKYDGVASSVTGTWTFGQSLKQWGRVFIHTPDHGAWAQNATYNIYDGSSTTPHTRQLPQRNYANEWKSVGVFNFNGVPKISLSNVTGDSDDKDAAVDIAWDAVAIQPLAAKPSDFIVSIGDSYSSGEGSPGSVPGGYYPVTDNNGLDPTYRNACHRSPNAWVRKGSVRGLGTIGSRADSLDTTLDFHQISCSGATSANLLGTKQYEPAQLGQGYIDENTTLVTASIGGNDIGFSPIITDCVTKNFTTLTGDCETSSKPGAYKKLADLGANVESVIDRIRKLAPKATIYFMGYPPIFSDGVTCSFITDKNQTWLDQMAKDLNSTIKTAVANKDTPSARVLFSDPATAFAGRNACSDNPAINNLTPYVVFSTPTRRSGELPMFTLSNLGPNFQAGVSAASFHPNNAGTDIEAAVMKAALNGKY